jgi:hypothetical protein
VPRKSTIEGDARKKDRKMEVAGIGGEGGGCQKGKNKREYILLEKGRETEGTRMPPVERRANWQNGRIKGKGKGKAGRMRQQKREIRTLFAAFPAH